MGVNESTCTSNTWKYVRWSPLGTNLGCIYTYLDFHNVNKVCFFFYPGLVLSLGLLFTSFADEFYQLFFSYGAVICKYIYFLIHLLIGYLYENKFLKLCLSALGICMIRDSNTAMLGQYFKKKRALVELALSCSSGFGLAAVSFIVSRFLR